MSLDLGNIRLGIEVDTTRVDRALQGVQTKVDGVRKSVEGSSLTPDVTPKGVRELDAAGRTAEGLAKGLDNAAAAAQGIRTPTGMSRDLGDAARQAQGLQKGLTDAAAAGDKVDINPAVTGQLDAAAGAADRLTSGLREASAAGQAIKVEGPSQVAADMDAAGLGVGALASGFKSLVPAIGAAAGVSAVFTKGLDRLTSIDNAQAKLRGLGHDAQSVEAIMTSSLDSVRGTAYGLGDAVSTAASSVAAGIKPGDELTRTLTAVADTAAIAGADMGEMGMIFNSVAARGKLQGDDLMQLMSRGVPVLALVAEQLGVTTEEASKMASEGAISFDMFVSAMEAGMGGAATEMGETFSGALANVGAAAGRAGAALLNPGFQEAPSLLAGVKDGLDMATTGIEAMWKAWDVLPGPVQTSIVALGAANTAAALLNTEMGQKATGILKDFAGGWKDTGSKVHTALTSMKDAYKASSAPLLEVAGRHKTARDAAMGMAAASKNAFTTLDFQAQAAGHSVAATSTGMIGHMKGIGGAAKSMGGSIINALGGPVVVGVAAAGIAISALVEASSRASRVQEAMAVASRDAAAAQDDLAAAVAGTTGELNAQALAAGARIVNAELSEMINLGGELQGWFNVLEAPDLSFWQQGRWSSEWRAYRDNAVEMKDQFAALEDAAHKVGIPMEELNAVVAEGGRDFDLLVGTLGAGGDAAQGAAEQLIAARDAFLESAEAARELDPAALRIRDGIAQIADEAGGAQQNLSGMKTVLQEMGILADGSDEALFQLAANIRQLEEDMSKLVDKEVGLGDSLFNGDTWDHANINAATLHDQLDQLGTMFLEVGANADPQEIADAWADLQPILGMLQKEFQLTDEQMERVTRQAGLVPEEVAILARLEGADEAVQELGTLWSRLHGMEEGETVRLTIEDDDAKEALASLGYQLDEIEGRENEFDVTAQTEEARGELENVIILMDEVGDRHVEPSVLLNATPLEGSAQHAQEILDTLDIQEPSPHAKLIMEEFLEGKDLTMGELAFLSSQSATPVAELVDEPFLSKSGVVKANLEKLGASKAEPVVDAKTDQAQIRLRDVFNAIMKIPLRRQVEIVTTSISRAVRGNALGGVAGVDGLPVSQRLAGGGTTHGGYRLPTSGPGTGRTDGILGVDSYGLPVAWVDRGEWVTNRHASQKYNATLTGINLDDPALILAGLARELPALESGGVTAAQVKSELSQIGTPYIFGGWSTAGVDCSGAVSAAANLYDGRPMLSERAYTGNMGEFLAARGFVDGLGGPGTVSVGWKHGGPGGGHTAMTLEDGTNVESGGNTGQGLTIGGKATGADDPYFDQHMHLPLMDQGGWAGGSGSGSGSGSVSDIPSFTGGGRVSASAEDRQRWHAQAGFDAMGATAWANAATGINALITQHQGTLNALGLNPQMMPEQMPEIDLTPIREFSDLLVEAMPIVTLLNEVGGEGLAGLGHMVEAHQKLIAAQEAVTDNAYDIAAAQEALEEARLAEKRAQEELAELSEGATEVSVSNARKIADAEEAVAKAREDGKADKIADAEKRLASAREDAEAQLSKDEKKRATDLEKAHSNVSKATKKRVQAEANLADVSGQTAGMLRDVTAAQFGMAASAVQAFAEIGGAVAGSLSEMWDAQAAGWAMVKDMALEVEELRHQLALDEMDVAKLAVSRVSALRELRKAEAARDRVALETQTKLKKATDAAGRSMGNTIQVGENGIRQLADAQRNYERTGVWAMETITIASDDAAQAQISGIHSVMGQEHELQAIQQQGYLDEIAAHEQVRLAQLAVAEATYQQHVAAQLLALSTEKARIQAEHLYGITSAAATALEQEAQGKAEQGEGWRNVAEGAGMIGAGAAAGFALAGPVGALVGGAIALIPGGAKMLEGGSKIITGKQREDAYREAAAEERANIDPAKLREIDTAGALAFLTSFGGADGSRVASTPFDEMRIKSDAAVLQLDAQIEALEKDRQLMTSEFELQRMLIQEQAAQAAEVFEFLKQSEEDRAAMAGESLAVQQAYLALAEGAEERALEALQSQNLTVSELESIRHSVEGLVEDSARRLAELEARPTRVDIVVEPGVYSDGDVVRILNDLTNRVAGLEGGARVADRPTAVASVQSQTR